MANDKAIAAVSETVRGLLEDALAAPEFSGAEFKVYNGANLQQPMPEGLSVFLYRVTANTSRRNAPAPPSADGKRRRPPLWLDLHYLIIAWAKEATKQQLLLGRAARILEDAPILPAALLNHYGPAADIFREPESVELSAEPLSIQDEMNIWEVAKHHHQPSISYVARMVAVESTRVIEAYGPVQTRAFEFAEAGS